MRLKTTTMKVRRAVQLGALLGVVFAAGVAARAQSDWKVEKTLKVGGQGSWDYLTVDAQSHRLFVPRSTHTMVLDEETGKVLGDIPGQKIAHGVAIVPAAGRGFITDGGGEGKIIIFDLKTYAILGELKAKPDADGILYDEADKKILVVAGDSGVLMTVDPMVDPKNGKIDAPIELGGAPEFFAPDGRGKVFINLEDKSNVAVVNLKTRKVEAHWPVAPGGSPVGMSIDRKKERIFIGCRKPQLLVVMSTTDGKILSSVPIGQGVDATIFSEGEAFASTRDGALTVATEKAAGQFSVAETVKTPVGARTMGMDNVTHRIYLPTAEFEEQKPGATGRPVMKPGSFMVVVVGR